LMIMISHPPVPLNLLSIKELFTVTIRSNCCVY
jgi:hypothetical protein